MKIKLKIKFLLGIIATLVLSVSITTTDRVALANSANEELISPTAAYSKYVEVRITSPYIVQTHPVMIYDDGMYRGTIDIVRVVFVTENKVEFYYGGNVYCYSNCILPSSVE